MREMIKRERDAAWEDLREFAFPGLPPSFPFCKLS
jgi:hypothetical protein